MTNSTHVRGSRRTSVTRWVTRRTARDARRSRHQEQRAAAALYDLHGAELYALACVLTDDPETAASITLQAIAAHHSHPCTRQELSAAVHVAWTAWGPAPTVVDRTVPAETDMLRELHGLPDDQRSALGLCRFGAHTYRQAAETLGLPAAEVLRLLREAMRALAPPVHTVTAPAA